MKNIYTKVKQILLAKEDPNKPGKKLFRHCALDFGQFERLIGENDNRDKATPFPAVFIHFTNIYYYQQAGRINQGRGTMRIRFVLEHYGDNDDFVEVFDYADLINQAISDSKDSISDLLTARREFFDMPTSNSALTAGWVDFNIVFQDSSGYKDRDYIEVNWPPVVDVNEETEMIEPEEGLGN